VLDKLNLTLTDLTDEQKEQLSDIAEQLEMPNPPSNLTKRILDILGFAVLQE